MGQQYTLLAGPSSSKGELRRDFLPDHPTMRCVTVIEEEDYGPVALGAAVGDFGMRSLLYEFVESIMDGSWYGQERG